MNHNLGSILMMGLIFCPLVLTGCLTAPSATTLFQHDTSRSAPDGYQVAAIRSFSKHKGDYLPAHNFKLEMDAVVVGSFQNAQGVPRSPVLQEADWPAIDLRTGGFKEVSGLEAEVEVIEYRNGDDPITHKRAGKAKYKNITLKRGQFSDPSVADWLKKVLAGTTDRKSGSIIYLDREGSEILRYNFFEAWPVRWKIANRDSQAIVEIEFAVERIEPAGKALPGDPIPGIDVR